MNKKSKYAINGAIWLSILNAGLNAIRQYIEISNNPKQNFDWNRVLIAGGKGAIVGAVGGLSIGAIADYENSKELPIDTDLHLKSTAKNIRLNKESDLFKSLYERGKIIIEALHKEYYYELSTQPIPIGSAHLGTALLDNFDLDYGLLFKANSFPSTEAMYMEVASFLLKHKERLGIDKIREQRKSIGLFVNVLGEDHKIDIVPCKKTIGSKTSGYLYKKNTSFLSDNSSYTKTDIPLISQNKLTQSQKDIIVLLKNWRDANNIPLGSHLLQTLVLDAFNCNKGRLPKNISERVIMVGKHISNHFNNMRLTSIENTNNIISNIEPSTKQEIIRAFAKLIEDYDYQPNSLVRNIQ